MKNLVWIASYPRSGNTWFRLFLSRLLSAKQNLELNDPELHLVANSRMMFDDLAGISSSDLSASEIRNLRPVVYKLLSGQSTQNVYLKTHERFEVTPSGNPLFPVENTKGCVYIIRNPLDVAVSNAHYFGISFDKMAGVMNNPDQRVNTFDGCLWPLLEEAMGTWSDHVVSWLQSGIPVYLMRYEDMVSKPFETFKPALDFLGLSFEEEQIFQSIHETSFTNLKQSEERYGFREKYQGTGAFFRNGKPGNWQQELSAEIVKRITDDHRQVMQQHGYL